MRIFYLFSLGIIYFSFYFLQDQSPTLYHNVINFKTHGYVNGSLLLVKSLLHPVNPSFSKIPVWWTSKWGIYETRFECTLMLSKLAPFWTPRFPERAIAASTTVLNRMLTLSDFYTFVPCFRGYGAYDARRAFQENQMSGWNLQPEFCIGGFSTSDAIRLKEFRNCLGPNSHYNHSAPHTMNAFNHMAIYFNALLYGMRRVIVLEDDVLPFDGWWHGHDSTLSNISVFRNRFSEIIEEIPADFDLIMLSTCLGNGMIATGTPVKRWLVPIHNRTASRCASGYIISETGMRRMLARIHLLGPIDHSLNFAFNKTELLPHETDPVVLWVEPALLMDASNIEVPIFREKNVLFSDHKVGR